jgi:uncharacterized membrane protein YfcA
MMPDLLILLLIGLAMGFFGGLLGIGGSVVMIPAMVVFFRQRPEDQHLFQAAAMICNFFVGLSAAVVHRREKALVAGALRWLVPAAAAGIIAGVWLSNRQFFSAAGSVNLTRCFGVFLVYVAAYNFIKLRNDRGSPASLPDSGRGGVLASLTGLATGLSAGLLGTGGGTVSTPMQQLVLGMPLKNAISNSAAVISVTALIGAVYKNLTLSAHGIAVTESLKIAAVVIPAAIAGSLTGGRLLHILPRQVVRAVFAALLALAAARLLAG